MPARFLTASVVFLVAMPAVASEWHQGGGTARTGTQSVVARHHLVDQAPALDLSTVSLRESKRVAGNGFATVRFQQRYDDLPVIGGDAAVRVDDAGRVKVTVLNVARALNVTTIPSVSRAEATHLAAKRAGLVTDVHCRPQLAILPDGDMGTLIWEVDVPTVDGGWRFWIDAHAGSLLHERPLAVHALGTVYPISSVTTPDTQDLELTGLDLGGLPRLNGWNGNLQVTNYVSGDIDTGNISVMQSLEPNVGDDFLYPPPAVPTDASDGFAQVSVFHHLTRMRDFATDVLGVDMTGPEYRVVAVANFLDNGNGFNNAFYSSAGISGPYNAPNLIAIGQGPTFDFAQDSDVFNHEFTHYLNGVAIGFNGGAFHIDSWGISHFSGAIDEGISDYFATTVNGDAFLGEASLALLGSGRDLASGSKTCPESLRGEVHADGELVGSLGWSLREALGAEISDQLMWGATSLLTLGAPFGDFGRGLEQTADDMVAAGTMTAAQADEVTALIADRGLDDCGHELTIDDEADAPLQGLEQLCNFAKQEGFYRQSMFHYVAATAADDAPGLVIDIDLQGLNPNDGPNWNVYVRKNEHVSFSVAFPPRPVDYDYAVEGIVDDDERIVLNASSMPEFEPGTTYHLVLTHQHCGNALAHIAVSDFNPGSGVGGAGGTGAGGMGGDDLMADPMGDASSGCSCEVAGRRPARWGWLALLAAAAFRLRRDVS